MSKVTTRSNINSKVIQDRKTNSWGRLLKEQNDIKEPRKSSVTIGPSQNARNRNIKPPIVPPPKEKDLKHEVPVKTNKVNVINSNKIQSQLLKPEKPISNHSLVKKKSSHTVRLDNPSSRSGFSGSSCSTSVSGESIMMVDRSIQYSVTNLEGIESVSWTKSNSDVNQAGDSGLASLNPIRTLNFLVRELRGKLCEGSEDVNMSRIIRDMESTIGRLSKSNPNSKDNLNLNTVICEEDLKAVLDLLKNPPQLDKVLETEKNTQKIHKNTLELQNKLEDTCLKLEELYKQMDKKTYQKLKEEKQRLLNEIKLKDNEVQLVKAREADHLKTISELKKKNEEQSKVISTLKEGQSKSAALNAILNEQLQDLEKKYQQTFTEMQFLLLEKEKNLVLMKCKDQDIQEMRKNLEEIKGLVVQHISSIKIESTNSGTHLFNNNNVTPKIDFDDYSLMSSISSTVLQKNIEGVKNELPTCSSPVETLSPSPEEDESWRKISNVQIADQGNLIRAQRHTPGEFNLQSQPSQMDVSKFKNVKASLNTLVEDMKKQSKLRKKFSLNNIINAADPISTSNNWFDIDISDELNSISESAISDGEIEVK